MPRLAWSAELSYEAGGPGNAGRPRLLAGAGGSLALNLNGVGLGLGVMPLAGAAAAIRTALAPAYVKAGFP